jgi:sulfatase maturation enzyme AslB (radical SAM superfamily)
VKLLKEQVRSFIEWLEARESFEMHFTLHLTQKCNMRCTYCYVKQGNAEMSLETAKKVVELSGKTGNKAGLSFSAANRC